MAVVGLPIWQEGVWSDTVWAEGVWSDTSQPEPEPTPSTITSLLLVNIFEVYNPIVFTAMINNKKAVSTFARGTNIVFSITSKARYQIPRVTLESDVCFISIQDPKGVVRQYRAVSTKLDSSFYYAYQTAISDPIGPWKISFYSILNNNHYLTPVLIGFILE